MNNATNGSKDFSKTVRTALACKGIVFSGTTWLPGKDGSFANGERGYVLIDNGTQRIRTYLDVVAMVA